MSAHQRTAIITGASSGIGLTVVETLVILIALINFQSSKSCN